MKIVALDFETANTTNQSICAVGIAVFADGQLVDSLYSLIRPPKGYGFFRPDWISDCHGLTYRDVSTAPEFPAIAPEIFARLAAADVVVAHNAGFDLKKMRATATHFGLSCPAFDYLCTYRLAEKLWPQLENHRLPTIAAHIGHRFNHHNAQADAEACGRILLAMMKEKSIATPCELAAATGATVGRFN